MFGRLPKIYRWRTAAVVMVLSILAGGWLARGLHPSGATLGVLIGALAGLALTYLALHQFHSSPRPIRIRIRD